MRGGGRASGIVRTATVQAWWTPALGRHRVRITPPTADSDPMDDLGDPQGIQPPPHFLDGSIEFTVPSGGTGEADFHLQAAPG